ncbi:MAG: 3'-5' exonuclease, partial [Spongiibacteraceae bacterium]
LLDFAALRLSETDPDHPLTQLVGCVELPDTDADCVAPWRAIISVLLKKDGDWYQKLDKRHGFPVGDNTQTKAPYKIQKEKMLALIEAMSHDDMLSEVLIQLRHLPTPNYPDSQWQMLRQLMLLLPVAAAQLKVVFQQRGEVDYTEVAQAALHALGEADAPGELLLRLDSRIRHILVDEFQDTSSSQFHLLERLLEGWQEHNAGNVDQQTLFIVGDGMQSIYGFRAANVGLFLGARSHGVNGVALAAAALSVNFRSTPTIVDWVNRIFVKAFPQFEKISRGAVPYENSQAFNADRAGSEVRVFGLRADDGRIREAAQCVQLVQQALYASTDGEIAVLVRNRSHLRAIVPALSAAGIPWRAADIDPLAARTAVMDLLSLYKALSNLADRIAWLAVLRSPLVGLNNSDLHTLVTGEDDSGGNCSIWSQMVSAVDSRRVSADGFAALSRAVEVIGAAFAQRERKSPRSWLEGVWLALGGTLCLASDDDWRNIYTLFDLIEALPPGAAIEQLETLVATLYAKPPALAGARLWLMTIHKSKGLEFDTVIIPGLDKMPRSDDKPLLQWGEYLDRDGNEGLVLAAAPAFGGADDAIYDWLDFERKQKQQLEDTRLFYVAATRAISRLYLLFCDNRPNNEKPFAPASRSLLSRIWSGVEAGVSWIEPIPTQISLLDRDSPPHASADALTRVPPAWRLPLAASGTLAFDRAENLPDLTLRVDSAEIHAGVLIHGLLEQCANAGVEHWLQRTATQQRALVEQLVKQRAVPAAHRDDVVEKIVFAINAALADERGRWLFDSAHTEAVAEWELSLEDGRLVVDRSFVDRDGVRWIVDYKTSKPHDSESLPDFYAREADNYRAQLNGYRDAVAALDTRPIRLALYFPCVPGWHEL